MSIRATQLVQGRLDRQRKPVVRRGRKATGLHSSEPGYRTQEDQMRAGTAITTGLRHTVGVGIQAVLIAAIVAALAFAMAAASGGAPSGANAVFAAKGGPAGGGGSTASWITLAQPEGLTAAAQVTLGTNVTFAAGYPSNTRNPRVEVLCYQPSDPSGLALFDPARGYLVYGETGDIGQALGDGTSPLGYNGFLLGGGMSAWLLNGGSADCVANLFYFGKSAGTQTFNILASTTFAAS